MSWFTWLYGGSKSAKQARARTRESTLPRPGRVDADDFRIGGMEDEVWNYLVSSNVDRIRYHKVGQQLQVVFKDGSCYQYESVEEQVYRGMLSTHSPGQYVHYVLKQGGYSYSKVSEGHTVSPPSKDVFAGQPFAIPPEIEAIEKRKGLAGFGVPKGEPWEKPPSEEFWPAPPGPPGR